MHNTRDSVHIPYHPSDPAAAAPAAAAAAGCVGRRVCGPQGCVGGKGVWAARVCGPQGVWAAWASKEPSLCCGQKMGPRWCCAMLLGGLLLQPGAQKTHPHPRGGGPAAPSCTYGG